MGIAAILFDLDETLVIEEAAVDAAFLATCQRVRERFEINPEALVQSVRLRARELWRASPTIDYCWTIGISSWEGLWARFLGEGADLRALREWAPTYRREAWSNALADHGVQDAALAEELAAAFPEEQRPRRTAFPDAEPVLRELQASYRLGLVTNGVPDLQREKLRGAGLTGYFDAVIISGEVGVGKPDPRIFEAAVATLTAGPEETVMVGDNLRRDIEPAQRMGIRAVWINRSGKACENDVRPDAQINSLSQLPDLLC